MSRTPLRWKVIFHNHVGGNPGKEQRSAPGGDNSQKSWARVFGQLPKPLLYLRPKSAIFQCPIYDMAKKFDTLCGCHSCPKHKLWRAFVDGPINNDEKVAYYVSKKLECKNHTLLMTKMAKINTLLLFIHWPIHSFILPARQFSLWISCYTLLLISMLIFPYLTVSSPLRRQLACFLTYRFEFF